MEVKVLLQVIDMFSEWVKVVPCSLAASGVTTNLERYLKAVNVTNQDLFTG